MKTKIKLSIIILFFSLVSKGQSNWAGLSPSDGNDSIYTVSGIAFDSLNHAYVFGESYNSLMAQLFYYNGSSWVMYTLDKDVSDKMIMDKSGKLWFAGQNFVLNYFNPLNSLLTNVTIPPQLASTAIQDIAIDNTNKKWILSHDYNWGVSNSYYLSVYNGTNWSVFDSSVAGITNSSIGTYDYPPFKILTANNSSSIYTINSINYIVKFDGTTWTKIDSSNSNFPPLFSINDAAIDRNDHIWMLCKTLTFEQIVVMYDGVQFHTYKPPHSYMNVPLFFSSLITDSANNILLYITDDGLLKFDGINWSIHLSFLDAFLPWPNIGISYEDKKGKIWTGRIAGGASYPITLFNENGFQTISGNVYKDVNSNGVRDVNDNGMAHEMISTSEGIHALTDTSGNYNVFFLDSSAIVTIDHPLKKYRYHSSSPTSYSINPLTQSTTGKDFGVAEMSNINDLQIYCNLFPTRPGFNSYGGIDYYNIGTTTLSDTITLQLDGRYTFLYSYPPPDIINGNKLQWLFNNLTPLKSGHISLNLRVDSTAVIGDTLFSLVTINPIVSDTVPTDNMDFIYKVVHGSYDPNEKEVEPKGTGPNGNIPNGQTLNYTIHFQNTGTDTAFTVTVKDTLSSNLDINTFQITGSSHPVVTELKGTGNLKFTFYNILLPDSTTNLGMSQGYISYKIKAIDNLPLGTEIKNTGYIYFDFNAPIVTNTTLNTIANTAGISLLKNDYSTNVFPNPLQDVATLEINGMNLSEKLTVKLYDVMGREMNVGVSKIDNKRFAIHRSDLASGLYFYKVSDGNVLISSGKITVQ